MAEGRIGIDVGVAAARARRTPGGRGRSQPRALLSDRLGRSRAWCRSPSGHRASDEGTLGALEASPLTPADPLPSAVTQIKGQHPPGAAGDRLGRGPADPVGGSGQGRARARMTVEAGAAHDPAALLGALRDLFPSCFCFCFGTPEASFIGASPELLDPPLEGRRRDGRAGRHHPAERGLRRRRPSRRGDAAPAERSATSTGSSSPDRARAAAPRGLGPRREQPFVIRSKPPAPRTPIRAQLTEARSADRARRRDSIRPPRSGASRAIGPSRRSRSWRGIDRGWYTGPIGWMDAAEDGEFCVGCARRCSATARPTCSPAAGSSPTPIRPRSYRSRSSSSRRCCRC